MISKNDDRHFELNDETLDALLRDALGVGRSQPSDEDCPAETEIFDYVYGDIQDEITRVEIKAHMDSCRICRSRFLRMESEKAFDEWRFRKRSSLWEAYQEARADLNGFLAARLAVVESFLEKITDMSMEVMFPVRPGARGIVAEPAGAQSLRGEPGDDRPRIIPRSSYTVGQPSPAYPLKVPSSEPEKARFIKFRYHTLIVLHPQREEIIVQFENKPLGEPLQVSPAFHEEDVGINELYLILSADPLDLDEEETALTPDRFVEIITEAENEEACITVFEVEVKS